MWDRYSRQMLFAGMGREGQEKLAASRVLLVGCGALGTVLGRWYARVSGSCGSSIAIRQAEQLAAQILFVERDVTEDRPRPSAAAERLSGSTRRQSQAIVADALAMSAFAMACFALDGGQLRDAFLINDVAVNTIPWVMARASLDQER
jgi:adenylyltransferase/sulfurtransferase